MTIIASSPQRAVGGSKCSTFDFKGKHFFIAGGTSGINFGIALAFAQAGANLTVISRSQKNIDEAQRQLSAHGGEVIGLSADVRNIEAVTVALKSAHGSFGEIDILVSGAAGNFPSPALGMSANAFKTVVEIDLLGTLQRFEGCTCLSTQARRINYGYRPHKR